ncbi:MAG TPA: aryl-sulfate sulfotransferase N-terminal domain-containing protein [Atopostipes sp.]|nr:aryl-sulfate sulfotransferase N-terminal domain-containing protein [Atopostipes sp.]
MKRRELGKLFLVGALILAGCAGSTEETEQGTEEPTQEETTSETDTTTTESQEIWDEVDYDSIEYTSDVEAQYTTQLNEELLNQHEERQEEILNEYQAGDYTFLEPLVHIDPYERSPLSALVSFQADEPMDVTVTVEGDTEHATISHTYTGVDGDVHLPVLGLYADRENTVVLTGETESGEEMETTLALQTAPLPEDLLGFTVQVAETD